MKASEFFTMTAIMSLMISIVIFMSAKSGMSILLGGVFLIYFLAVIMVKMMWGISGKMDEGLQAITGGGK